MIGAGEGRGIAELGAAQPVAAVAADIQKGMNLAAAVAHDQHWVFTHVGSEEVPRLRDLALMAKEEPTASENPLQLLLVDLGLDEDPAADQPVIGVDETGDVLRHTILLSA